jgi:hypothetical protein
MAVGTKLPASLEVETPKFPVSRAGADTRKKLDNVKGASHSKLKQFCVFAFRLKMLVWWTLAGVIVGVAIGAGL